MAVDSTPIRLHFSIGSYCEFMHHPNELMTDSGLDVTNLVFTQGITEGATDSGLNEPRPAESLNGTDKGSVGADLISEDVTTQ